MVNKKGKVTSLFPDVHYIPNRKGAKINKKRQILNLSVNAQIESESNAIQLKKTRPNFFSKLSDSTKKKLFFVGGFLLVALGFLPVLFK